MMFFHGTTFSITFFMQSFKSHFNFQPEKKYFDKIKDEKQMKKDELQTFTLQ